MSHLYLPVGFQYGLVVRGVDLKTTGAVTIGTPSALFIPTAILFRIASANTVTSVATASVGTNGASYNNLLAATALTNLDAVNEYQQFPITTLVSAVTAGTDIKVNITVGAVATTLTGDIWVLGIPA